MSPYKLRYRVYSSGGGCETMKTGEVSYEV